MKHVSVFLEDKPGALSGVCECLARRGINILSLFGTGMKTTGQVTFITQDVQSAQKELEQNGYKVEVSDVLTMKLSDRPGELAKMTKTLAKNKVNIESIYLLEQANGQGTFALKVDNQPLAERVLK